MANPIRVLLLGTGQMGSAIARLLLQRPALALVGAYGRRSARTGIDLGAAIGLDRMLELPVSGELMERVEATRPEVAIQATCSTLAEAQDEIETLLSRGVNVVSIAEEMAWPEAASPERAARLDSLARHNGVTLLGTGINPGFVLDFLVVTLTAACWHVESITARRVNDLSPYGPTVLRSQGVGLTPDAFREQLEAGGVTGHFGFPQSIGMIASALGWEVERIEERREPIVSDVRRETPFVSVEPGCSAGCLHEATGWVGGRPAIRLIHPQQIHPEIAGVETGDYIEIDGTPPIRLAGSPEIPGGEATAALAVNVIPRVLAAPPGLATMVDLPVPSAFAGDVRARFYRGDREGTKHA